MVDKNITQSLDTWTAQQNYVERAMDNSALTAGHPDTTLVLAGPARYTGKDVIEKLTPIGALINFQISSNVPLQPMQQIGSGRTFYTRGKGNVSFSIQRLFVNGRSLLRVLKTVAIQDGIPIQHMDDPAMAGDSGDDPFVFNLDSELFYIPFGLAILFQDKTRRPIGAIYLESTMIQAHSISVSAGQGMIMESVSGVADRGRPILRQATSYLKARAGNDLAPTPTSLNEVAGVYGTDTEYAPQIVGADAR